MSANTFQQTARFLATLSTSMPALPVDVMQRWIENPRSLRMTLRNLLDPRRIPQLEYCETKTFTASHARVEKILESVPVHSMNEGFKKLLEGSSYHLDHFVVDSYRSKNVSRYDPFAIIAELGGDICVTLSNFASMVVEQAAGETGTLAVDGGNNLAYFEDFERHKAVTASWSSEHKGWILGVYELGDIKGLNGFDSPRIAQVITKAQR